MSEGHSPVILTDSSSGDAVPAILLSQIGEEQISDWNQYWRPALEETLARLRANQVPKSRWPQSAHWDWEFKTKQMRGLLAFRGFAVVAQGVTQGLMRVDLNHSARRRRLASPWCMLNILKQRLGTGAISQHRGTGEWDQRCSRLP